MRHENQTNDPIFLSAFRALLFRKIIFTFENCQSLFSWGPLWSVMVCKILNFEVTSGNIHTEESKKPSFTFSAELRINSKIFRIIS